MWRATSAVAAAAVLVMSVGGVGPTPAGAMPRRPVTITEHEFKASIVIEHIENPCTGVLGTLTEVENGVFHLTASGVDVGDPNDPKDDTPLAPFTSTFNVENKFTFVPDVSDEPTYVGHSHTHISEKSTTAAGVRRLENTVVAKGDDGSVLRVHQVARAVIDAVGTMTIVFDHATCVSG